MGIMITEKILITLLVQLKFWDQVRDLILLPIKDPKVATIIVLLVIPFFVNVSLISILLIVVNAYQVLLVGFNVLGD